MKVMTIKRLVQIWFAINSVVILAELAPGQELFDAGTDSLIQAGIELSIQHDYYRAEGLFQQLIDRFPDHPVGYFFMAATIQSKMMDYESDRWRQDFQHYIQLSIESAKKYRIESQGQDAQILFYHGSALCYLAFFEGRNGDYLKAIRHGLSGISILKKIIEKQPEFYDAYFGIGSYKYWRSQATRYLNWLPLLSDDRQQGIEMVLQAVAKGKHTRYAAINELIWILLDSGRAGEAYTWALKGLENFPRSRFFLWGAAKSAFVRDDFLNAVFYYQQLLNSITNAPFDNYYNEFLCRLKLAQCYARLEKYPQASHQVEILKSLPLSSPIKGKLKKQQKELARLEKSLSLAVATNLPVDSLITKDNLADEQGSQ